MVGDLLFSLFCSVPGISSSSFSSPNFLNCFSLRELALVFADYLRSHFSVSQPKAFHSKARGYLSELFRAMYPEESRSFFFSPFSPAEYFASATSVSSSTAMGPDKVAYPILKHLPRSGMDFLLQIFNLSFPFLQFLFFHLEDIFYYPHPQDGKASRLSCFVPVYLSHLLGLNAF